jgi:hypothetical protein
MANNRMKSQRQVGDHVLRRPDPTSLRDLGSPVTVCRIMLPSLHYDAGTAGTSPLANMHSYLWHFKTMSSIFTMSGDGWHCVEGPIKGRQLLQLSTATGNGGVIETGTTTTGSYNNLSAFASDRTKEAEIIRLATRKLERARAETTHSSTCLSRYAKQSFMFEYYRFHASLCRHPDRNRVRPIVNLQQRASLVLCRRTKRERLDIALNTLLPSQQHPRINASIQSSLYRI